MSKSASPVRNFLADNPKWIGVLFWLTVLMTQAGMAAGAGAGANVGP